LNIFKTVTRYAKKLPIALLYRTFIKIGFIAKPFRSVLRIAVRGAKGIVGFSVKNLKLSHPTTKKQKEFQ